MSTQVLQLLVVLLSLSVVMGGVHFVDDNIFGRDTIIESFAVYNATGSVFSDVVTPYIVLDLSYDYVKETDMSGKFHILVFHQDVKDKLGFKIKYDTYFCCDQNLLDQGVCKSLNSFIVNDTIFNQEVNTAIPEVSYTTRDKKLFYWSERSSQSSGIQSHTYQLEQSGVWYLQRTFCGELEDSVKVEGSVEWKGSTGYVNAEMFPFLIVFPINSGIYLILLIFWGVMLLRYRAGIMGLQYFISVVIVLGLIESIWWSITHMDYNDKGHTIGLYNVLGAFLTSSKITSFRTLVLLLGLGYSITNVALTNIQKLGALTITIIYFFVAGLVEYFDFADSFGILYSSSANNIATLLLSTVDTIFIFWIGYEFYQRLLAVEGQFIKKRMYRKLFAVFLVVVVLSIILFFLQFLISFTSARDDLWDYWWLWEAYWQYVYLFLLIVIAIIWKPNPNNAQYAYVNQEDSSSIGEMTSEEEFSLDS